MWFFTSKKAVKFSVYDLPQPLQPPESIRTGTAPPVPADSEDVDPTDPLSVAIFYHERNLLDIAAYYFSLSAAQGNPLGLFLYAISLRHGWGVAKNEEEAVRLLQVTASQAMGEVAKHALKLQRLGKRYSHIGSQPLVYSMPYHGTSGSLDKAAIAEDAANAAPAAEKAAATRESPLATVPETPPSHHQTSPTSTFAAMTFSPQSMTMPRPQRNTLQRAAKDQFSAPPQLSELVLAIFELAMSFKQGWGVPKNKITAVYYLNMASEMGDPDAQVELAECYLRGEGIKPNKKMAAYWFRKAEKQGVRLVQMQWIWKNKYDFSVDETNGDGAAGGAS